MTRTLTITAAEVPEVLAAIQSGEHVWLVREGQQCEWNQSDDAQMAENGYEDSFAPPVEFALACAPCETCGNQHIAVSGGPGYFKGGKLRHLAGGQTVMEIRCPDCRIELVRPCPNVDSWGDPCEGAYEIAQGEWRPCPLCDGENAKPGTVTLGHAYAVGEPLPINDHHQATGDFAHYGDPESLVGKWALQLAGL